MILATNPKEPTALFTKAVALHKLQRWEEALAVATLALDGPLDDVRSGQTTLRLLRAECLYQTKQPAEALKEADLAIDEGAEDDRVHSVRAHCLYLLGNDHEALEAVEKACKTQPQNAAMQHLRGVLLHAVGQHQDALGALNRASRLGPEDPLTHFERGRVLRQLADTEAAMAAFKKAIALDPDLPFVHNIMGIMHSENGDMEDALQAWETAIALDPEDSSMHANKGKCLHKLERHEEAIAEFQKALDLGADKDSGVQAALGECLAVLGRHEEARQALGVAVQQFPEEGALHALHAFSLQALGDLSKAVEAMETACKLESGEAKWHYVLGKMLHESSRHEEAMEALNRSLELDSKTKAAVDAFTARGAVVGSWLGDKEAALKDFEAALAIDADCFRANVFKAMALDEQGLPQQAIELWDKVAAMEQADSKILTHRGKCLVRLGKLEESKECFEKAMEESVGTAEPHKALGALYWQQGKKDEAYVAWSMGSDADPTDVYCHFLQGVYLSEIGEPERALEALDKALHHSDVPPQEVLEMRNAVAETLVYIDEARDKSWDEKK